MKSGYTVEVLWCPNARQGAKNGWSFPPAVRKHLIVATQGKRVLQLFGGLATFGTRIDIDPRVRPHVIADAWLPPFAKDSFDVVIIDPPYFHLNAQMKTALFRAAGWMAKESVIWFSTIWQAGSGGLKPSKAYLVRVGDSCHVRCLQYFDVVAKPGPVDRFNRGPAMKYNRWLVNPHGFAFEEVGPANEESPGPQSPAGGNLQPVPRDLLKDHR